jgi:hypothetical protein
MLNKFLQEMNNLQKLYENTGFVELVELEDGSVIITADRIDVRGILEENDFEYYEESDGIRVTDSFDELLEEFEEYDFVSASAIDLIEASAKRKVVIRRGKRKVIFKCAPGQKKVGPRRCVKRPSRDLMKMKRRARRAARKARRKRSQANRRRKISLRKRPHKPKHKK